MQGQVHDKYKDFDSLNRYHSRNIKNADKESYNCAGYALECFSWYCPRVKDDYDAFKFEDMEEAQHKTDRCVEIMLNDFPTLRVISDPDEANEDEYVFAFRLSDDGDFHYVKRDSNNHWRHKMGSALKIQTMRAADVLTKPWPVQSWFGCTIDRYNGPIVLFAKKIEGRG